jgi:hypothetical protein
MQTISVHSSDAETNLQNIAAVLQEHAVPKYFDEVQYVTEGENKGVQCYINGILKLLIDIDTSTATNTINYYIASWDEQDGFLHVRSGTSSQQYASRFTLIDVFDNCIAIHTNGVGSTTTSQDARKRSLIIAKSTENKTCVLLSFSSSIINSLTSSTNSITASLTIFNVGMPHNSFLYAWNTADTQVTNLSNLMCTDGSVINNIYWAVVRSGSNDEGVHPVLINGEQYYGLLYNQIIIKS